MLGCGHVKHRRRQSRPRPQTRLRILDAAREVLLARGAGAPARVRWPNEAGVRLSLVHYHFGGKQALLVAVLQGENERLLERQRALYATPGPLSAKWRTACEFLDHDIHSGYVRVLWELWAAGLADETLAAEWRAAMSGWRDLLESVFADWAADSSIELPLSPRGSRRSSPTSSRASRSSCSPASPSTRRRTARCSTRSAP